MPRGLAPRIIYFQNSEIPEPEWVGESIFLTDSTDVLKLENSKAFLKANAGASMYLTGVGNVKVKYNVKDNKSTIRINKKDSLNFIVNAGQNGVNPQSVVKIIKLLTNKPKKRYYVAAKSGTFTGTSSETLNLVSFTAKKHGQNSYLISVPKIEIGEYAIVVNESLDWNLFGID